MMCTTSQILRRTIALCCFFSLHLSAAFAGSESSALICPGEPILVTKTAEAVLGSCVVTPSNAISCPPVPAFSGQVLTTATDTYTIAPTETCSYTQVCNSQDPIIDGDNVSKSVSSVINVEPERQICCGVYSLATYTDWNAGLSRCENPAPVVSIEPVTGPGVTIPINTEFTFYSTTTDSGPDITIHNFTWEKPDGTDRYTGSPWGTVTYSTSTTYIDGATTTSIAAHFKPDHYGYYKVRFAAQDNATNTFNNYNGIPPRWTYSQWVTVPVVNGVAASINQGSDPTLVGWACTNSDKATLITTNGPTMPDFIDALLPPNARTFRIPLYATSTHTITCKNSGTGQEVTKSYTVPELSVITSGLYDVALHAQCNNDLAKSATITRGSTTVTNLAATTTDFFDNSLSENTVYDYTLKCYSGDNAQGTRLAFTQNQVTTVASDTVPTFTLSAYVRTSPAADMTYLNTQPINEITGDGSFNDWSYLVSGDPAASCTMQQKNDSGNWSTPYDTDPSTYTLSWTDLSPEEKAAFVSSYSNYHYWRLTCSDSEGKHSSLMWSVQKTPFYPALLSATIRTSCEQQPAQSTLTVICYNSDSIVVTRRSDGAQIANVPQTTADIVLPSGPDIYSSVCKLGSLTSSGKYYREVTGTECDTTIDSFTVTPRTITSGSQVSLRWSISNPTTTCAIAASPVCTGACSQERIDEAAAITTKLNTEYTDTNDPNNLNHTARTILDSLHIESFNNGVKGFAIGKKSLRVKHSTNFQLSCPNTPAIKNIQIQVSNDREG